MVIVVVAGPETVLGDRGVSNARKQGKSADLDDCLLLIAHSLIVNLIVCFWKAVNCLYIMIQMICLYIKINSLNIPRVNSFLLFLLFENSIQL